MKKDQLAGLIRGYFPDTKRYDYNDFIVFTKYYNNLFGFYLREMIFDNEEYGIYAFKNMETNNQKYTITFPVSIILVSQPYTFNEFIDIIDWIINKLNIIIKSLKIFN